MSKKIYELPISKNYVNNWGLEEAIREIMQNAIDSEKDGNEMGIEYSNETLTISNQDVNLDVSSLVLGNSGKQGSSYIGKYGEGFKLALIVLLRLGYEVNIYTNGQQWVPAFRKSRKFKIDTLHIDVFQDLDLFGINEDSLVFEIKGIEYETFVRIRKNNLAMMYAMGHSVGETIECEYGEILLNGDYKGKMFVEGLYVQQDSSFKYGYNFSSEHVDLDRDRKAINYYALRELTAKAMTSHDNVYLTEKAIVARSVDVRDIIDNLDEISEEFSTNFANDFMKRNELEEDTFVGTKKEVLVAKVEKSFIVEQKAIAALVNKGTGNSEQYKEVQRKARELTKKESAYEYYYNSNLESLIKFLLPKKDRFTEDELKELITILSVGSLHVNYFDEIKRDILRQFESEEDDE